MPFNLFPPSRVLLLNPDGRVETLDVAAPRFSGTTVVLARERCLFDPLETATGISSRQALTAARLRAQTAAPYQNAGYAITRRGQRFGIWWWDADWVIEQLALADIADNARVIPESLFYSAETGARIVRGTTGFEAQIWDQGFLVADLWRRKPFDEEIWREFLRQWFGGDEPLSSPPPPSRPPFLLNSPYRRTLLSSGDNARLIELGAGGAIIALLAISAFMFGNGLSLRNQAETLRAQTALEQAKAPARSRGQAEINQVVALKREVEHADPPHPLAQRPGDRPALRLQDQQLQRHAARRQHHLAGGGRCGRGSDLHRTERFALFRQRQSQARPRQEAAGDRDERQGRRSAETNQ